MKRYRAGLLGVLVAAISLAGCGVTDPELDQDGVVRFVQVEGGCWTIEVGEVRYEPINLEEEFRVDGLAVTFSANERPDLASICQVGTLIELTGIEVAGG